YLEEARVEYLRAVGRPYTALRKEGFELPVIEVAIRYAKPLHFDDLVRVHLVPAGVRGATFEIGYLLTVDDRVRSAAVTVHGIVTGGRPARAPDWLADLVPAGLRGQRGG
ncbi:MAG TPA: thioesterase family protein, partial [Acidimicrobiales bacterium]|nr:thioesterase family protein [Acidimicrobiales bacterium]